MLQTGTDAPDFSVNDHNGNTVNLKDCRGKKIVLWFYPKADTPGCTMEGQGFRDDFKSFEEKKYLNLLSLKLLKIFLLLSFELLSKKINSQFKYDWVNILLRDSLRYSSPL